MNISDEVYLHITIHGDDELVHLCKGIILNKKSKVLKVVITAINLVPVGQDQQSSGILKFLGKKVNRKTYQLSQKPPAWAVSNRNDWNYLSKTKTEEIINRNKI